MIKIFTATCLILGLSVCVMADSLYGTVTYKNKEKGKSTTEKKELVINTSWDYAKTAQLDEKGNYKIDFGEKVGQKISVYVNGSKYVEVEIKGDTKLDIVVR